MIDAFPYRRYSSGKQSKGNSLARQGEPFEALCNRMEWNPNYTLGLDDKGRSAYHAKHLTGKGRLGYFLALAKMKNSPIRPGSVLVIENQDRLSRQEVDAARELVRQLLLAGVNIFDQDDGVLLTKASLNDPLALIRMILRMERAHKESERKAGFSRDNWTRKRQSIGETKLTKMVPYWLAAEHHGDKLVYKVVKDREDMVRQIFRWCIEGVGIAAIASKLNNAKLKTGHKCKRVGSSSVQKILRNRAVLGEFTPMSGRGKDRKPSGPTITDYYPRIVEDGVFAQAQLALNKRGFSKGRKSKTPNNLLAGIAYNARDGYKLTFRDALPPRRPYAYLVSTGAIYGWTGSDYSALRYIEVEAAVLKHLSELDASTIFPDDADDERRKLTAMSAELEMIEKDLEELNNAMSEPGMAAALLPNVRRLVGRRNKLTDAYQALSAKCASPEADQLHTVQELLKGDFNPKDEDVRLRLRSAIQRLVSEIWILKAGTRNRPRYLIQIDYRNGQRRFIWMGHGVGPLATIKVHDLNTEYGRQYAKGLQTFKDNPDVFGFVDENDKATKKV